MKSNWKASGRLLLHALFGVFRSLVLKARVAYSADEANALLDDGWYLNNVETMDSPRRGARSRIRFMLVRSTRLGILVPKRVNQYVLVRPIAFGFWPLDANGNQVPSLVPDLLGNLQVAVNGGFKFADLHKLGEVHSGSDSNRVGLKISSPNVTTEARE